MTDTNAASRLRLLERHGAVSLRALSGEPMAEYRASRVRMDGKSAPFAAPYLAVDFSDATVPRSRGVMDSLGLRLRHSDFNLHNELTPASGFARLVFDVLEQMRCESLYDPAYKGLRGNLDSAFMSWCQDAHGNGFCDSELGILLYTVIHMVRARLIGTIEDETAEALIEATRANLGRVIGKSLYHLQHVSDDQRAFAKSASEIANALDAMVEDASSDTEDTRKLRDRHSIVLPPDWNDDNVDGDTQISGAGAGASGDVTGEQLDTIGDYHVFTNEFDVEVTGDSLLRATKRKHLREKLDQLVKAQAVSVQRLARELQALLATPTVDGWLFAQDEGLIDARRLSQLVSNPEYHQIFVREREQLHADTVVAFLVDNSGSMKRQRFEAVAVLLDTFCRAMSLADISTEVLGFTTADWSGGKAMQQWRAARQPEDPGRIGEVMHVVYKHADQSWRRSRAAMASLLDTQHFREGIDGEALVWAYRRLLQRPEARRYLVVISDGAPMDSATNNTNRENFLADHLASVAAFIERDPRVQLGGIGIDLDLSDTFRRCVSLDLGGTLGQASYHSLHELFGQAHT